MIEPSVVTSLSSGGGDDKPEEEFVGAKIGAPEVSPENVRRAICKMGVKIRYDEFSCDEVVEGLSGFGPDLDDAVMEHLYVHIWQWYNIKPGWDDFKRVVRNLARQDKFHPVKIYLESLKWQGQPRLDTWLQVYGNAESTPFISQVGALTLMAAVKRIYDPGCKFDEMLVLENPKQGTLKSSAWSVLAMKRQWFLDDLPLTSMTREVLEKTRGKWIIEGAELIGMTTARTVNKVKTFLTRQTDEARWVWKEKVTHKLREFVIVGSTNEVKWMFDKTGNRRFWPVRAGPFDIDKLARDGDHLWAEAVYRVKAGESIRLEAALWPAAEDEQKKRMVESAILDKLEYLLCEVDCGKISSAELVSFCYSRMKPADWMSGEIAHAMSQIEGWSKRKIRAGTPVNGYVKGEEPWPLLRIVGGKAITVEVGPVPGRGVERLEP
jgi:hypothetical protein